MVPSLWPGGAMHSRTLTILRVGCQPWESITVWRVKDRYLMSKKLQGSYEPCPICDSWASCRTPNQGPPPHPNPACAAPHPPIITPVVALSALFAGPSAGSGSARFSRRPTCPDTSVAGSLPTPPVPRHRKSHSLGNKWVTEQALPPGFRPSCTWAWAQCRETLADWVPPLPCSGSC